MNNNLTTFFLRRLTGKRADEVNNGGDFWSYSPTGSGRTPVPGPFYGGAPPPPPPPPPPLHPPPSLPHYLLFFTPGVNERNETPNNFGAGGFGGVTPEKIFENLYSFWCILVHFGTVN